MLHPAFTAELARRNPTVGAAASAYRDAYRAHLKGGADWRFGRDVVKPAEAALNSAVEDAVCGLRAA